MKQGPNSRRVKFQFVEGDGDTKFTDRCARWNIFVWTSVSAAEGQLTNQVLCRSPYGYSSLSSKQIHCTRPTLACGQGRSMDAAEQLGYPSPSSSGRYAQDVPPTTVIKTHGRYQY